MKSVVKSYLRYLYGSVVKGYSKALFSVLEKNPKAVVVDAGCWDGVNSIDYGKAVGTARLVGLEIVRPMARKALEKGVKVLISDLNKKIPLKGSVADVAVANHVIEHLYNVDGFVAELYRILRPGGYAVIGTPNLSSWHNVFALLIGRQPFSGPSVSMGSEMDAAAELRREKNTRLTSGIENKAEAESALGHIVVMTYKTLVKLLMSKGFVIEKSFGFGYHPFPPVIAQFLAMIDKSHSHYVLVKARKPGKSL